MGRTETTLESSFPFLAGALSLIAWAFFLEAGFLVSDVSYFSSLSFFQRVTILVDCLLFLVAPILFLWLVVHFALYAIHGNERARRGLCFSYSVLLSLIFFAITLSHMWIFVYTAVKVDVYDLSPPVNMLLAVLVTGLSVLFVIKKGAGVADFFLTHKAAFFRTTIIAMGIATLFAVHKVYVLWEEAADLERGMALNMAGDSRPNIILFSSDALDCRRLGAYGYIRDTTPSLDSLANTITYTRAYTNCGNSRGSIMSVLAGKSPITTKLIYPPDIFHDRDAYEHLPNILARLGYYNVDLNDGYFASTSKSNLRDGFHVENGQETDFAIGLGFWKRLEVAFSQERYLLTDLYEKHGNRLLYMIRPTFQPDHSARFMFTEEDPELEDAELIEMANEILRTTDQPVFVHLHLLATHGPAFSPRYRKFSSQGDRPVSAGDSAAIEEQRRSYYSGGNIPQDEFALLFSSRKVSPARQKKVWDLYDDAVFSVDHYFGEIVETLRETGKLENSMIIFMTDHGMGLFTTSLDKIRHPLPLVVYLPGQKGKKVVEEPVQYLDIAPSILAFLNQPIPEWMEGDVIFGREMGKILIPERPIFTAGAYGNKLVRIKGRGVLAQKIDAGPPHYGLDLLGLLFEENFFLYSPHLKSGNLYDIHEAPYHFQSIDSAEQKQQYHEMLRTHVGARGVGID